MKRTATFLATMILAASSAWAQAPVMVRQNLPNGIRVVLAQVPDAAQQVTFTFLPLTLANDLKDRAQWSHLLEHMVLRTTDPGAMSSNGLEINGETTAMYLRFDTYAKPDQWKASIERHAKWLAGGTFDAAILEREKGTIANEEQNTAKGGASSKFAIAAWNQAAMYGVKDIQVHGDVASATLPDLIQYAAERIPRDQSVMIASIGPIPTEQVLAELTKLAGSLPAKPWKAPTLESTDAAEAAPCGKCQATWDLPTRHALWWWPLPDQKIETLAAATLAARAIQMQRVMRPQRDPRVRNMLGYPCVVTPRGAFLVIDACLAQAGDIPNLKAGVPVITADEVLIDIQQAAQRSTPDQPGFESMAWIATSLVQQSPPNPDFKALRVQLPEAMRERAEGVWLLSMMNYEYPFNVPANTALSAIAKTHPGHLNNMLNLLQKPPAGSLELMPAKPVATTVPAATTAPAKTQD